MRASETTKLQKALKAKKSELIEALASRSDISVERVSETLDGMQLSLQREHAISDLDRQARLLDAAVKALDRIDDGTYGDCVKCGDRISVMRLRAVPWTAYCVRCQETIEAEEV